MDKCAMFHDGFKSQKNDKNSSLKHIKTRKEKSISSIRPLLYPPNNDIRIKFISLVIYI